MDKSEQMLSFYLQKDLSKVFLTILHKLHLIKVCKLKGLASDLSEPATPDAFCCQSHQNNCIPIATCVFPLSGPNMNIFKKRNDLVDLNFVHLMVEANTAYKVFKNRTNRKLKLVC